MWFLLPFFTALLLYASFYPWNISYLAWVALVPLALFAVREEKGWKVFWLSYAAGYGYYALSFSWTMYSVPVAPFILAIYLGLYFPLFAVLVRRFVRRNLVPVWLAVPICWTVSEYLKSTLFTGIPWFLLGHTQHPFLNLIQIADVTGVYGVSFLVAMMNGLIIDRLSQSRPCRLFTKPVVTFLVFLGLVFAYGMVRVQVQELKTGPRIAVIQANIPEDIRRHYEQVSPMEYERRQDDQFQKYMRLTRAALDRAETKPDLVVWAESAYPYSLYQAMGDRQFLVDSQVRRLQDASRSIGVPWITGTGVIGTRKEWLNETDWERHYGEMKKWNTALYCDREGRLLSLYDKVRLVPFVEYIPLKETLGFVKGMMEAFSEIPDAPDMTPGTQLKTMTVSGRKFAVIVCYEGIFPWITRDVANQGAEFVINISNDGWFRDSAELDQMLAMTRFRAIESRVGFIRATNTGISAFIAPSGEVEALIEYTDGKRKEVEGTLTHSVSMTSGGSLYRLWGDLFAQLVCLVMVWLLAAPLMRRTNSLTISAK